MESIYMRWQFLYSIILVGNLLTTTTEIVGLVRKFEDNLVHVYPELRKILDRWKSVFGPVGFDISRAFNIRETASFLEYALVIVGLRQN
jgi:hypothetical protein